MRNLKLLESLWVGPLPELHEAQCLGVDCDTSLVYCATAKKVIGIDPRSQQVTGVISLTDHGYLPPDGSGKVVGIQFLADQQSVCLATSTGNLLLWSVHHDELECVGTVDSGLVAMGWSPDLELLILITGQATFIMMNREFDPIVETTLHPENFGEAEFITVGWGKKETQFHGFAGKAAARVKPEDVNPVLPWDDRRPRVCWRGDGQYFVISTVSPTTGSRQLRVWSRECVHHSTSESVDGIEEALAWKPSGSLIATTQRRPNKHEVVFFEKNGLRHLEFTLPFGVKEVKVKEVRWNSDSTILMVWAEELNPREDTSAIKSYVQLWTVGNYHWYLKQSLQFEGVEDMVVYVEWDPEHAYRMHIMCASGRYLQYTWCWATNHSIGRTADDHASVAVIDGNAVLVTPMRSTVVPPPMSAYKIQVPCAVSQVTFSSAPNTNNIAVLLADQRLAVYTYDHVDGETTLDNPVRLDGTGGSGFRNCSPTPKLQGIYGIDNLPSELLHNPLSVHHVSWVASDLLLFCTLDPVAKQHSVLYHTSLKETENKQLQVNSQVDVEGVVHCISSNPDTGSVAVQLSDGLVLRYDPENETLLPWETSSGGELQFAQPCSQMAVCDIGGEEVVIGLTDRYRLYVNNTEVASNCTSFAIHEDFLLLTTLTHTCRCICRKTKVLVLPTLSDGKAHPFDESVRRVERGSRIVTVVPEDTKLILQMPRGNLETVHPRALVLSEVRKLLDRLQYKEAFTAMRKHRINMNLLYDHNPNLFLENVQHFLQQVQSVDRINLFLTDLQEEDVTVTMYTGAYIESLPLPVKDWTNKIDTVCDAVREGLISLDKDKYLLSILTSYVRKTTPELEAALQHVKSLRDNPSNTSKVSPEEALKYLLFLVDVNEFYDVALGTYDFDLVLMVAEKSQKDPKEYIPFLNELRKMEPNYMKYTIDKHLKRYERALHHISKCGADHFEECVHLIGEHTLHSQAMQLFTVTSTEYKRIVCDYGAYLSGKRRHQDAGLVYVKGEDWARAMESFLACRNWRQVFCLTARMKYSAEKEAELARDVAANLKEHRRHSEAAIVLEHYAQDVEEAIVTLIEGAQWEEALRLMYRQNRTDFIETNLKTALLESCGNLIETLNKSKLRFEKYKKRLAVVREEKEKAQLELLEGEGALNQADSDLFSDTSSATGESIQSSRYSTESRQSSVYSKMSGKSAKNRRKSEHKKWRLKEGSAFEDFALIAELANTVTHIDGLRDEVNSLLRVLFQFHYDQKASELQRNYDSFLLLMEQSIPDIWLEGEPGNVTNTIQSMLGPDTTANSIVRAMQQGQRSQTQEDVDPIIRVPPTLNKENHWKLYLLEQDHT